MLLSEIWIYPVKSLGGVRLPVAEVQQQGLKNDRRWLVVDENGVFLTQRTNKQMAMIDVMLHHHGVGLFDRFEPANQTIVPFTAISNEPLKVKIWKDEVLAFSVSDEADDWLSARLDRKVRIVEMRENTMRRMNPEDSENGELLSFADDFPFHLTSEASLADLNNKLQNPVEMKRFRPNFVISGTSPFEEDLWNYIKIGTLTFRVESPCERCVMTTIDTISGSKTSEPLKTLSKYRKVGNKILFGQNVIGLESGMIKEGDEVKILRTGDADTENGKNQ